MKYQLFVTHKYIFRSFFSFFLSMLLISNNLAQNTIFAPSPVDSLSTGTNYFEITAALDNYWNHQNTDIKGSGIKPYLRWKEMWKNDVRSDGTMTSAHDMVQSYMNLRRKSKNTVQLRNSNWIPLGPTSVNNLMSGSNSSSQGRINVIEIDPSNPNTIYIGSPGGGIWKSTNDGDFWEDISSNLPFTGISGIAVDYNNSDIIYVTSGDEDGSKYNATGVYRTIDGGLSWATTGDLTADVLGEIYVHPTNSSMLWLVSYDGVYRTTNGGASWNRKVEGNFKEIRLKPGDPNTIYALRDNFDDTELFISNDAGASFILAHTFAGIGGRAVIAVTPANPDYLYIMLSNNDNSFNSIRLSEDSGVSFDIKNNTGGTYLSHQSWYDLALGVSDTDSETLYYGCLVLHRSLDSGDEIQRIESPEWPIGETFDFHPDVHDIKIFNGKIYLATDGGISISYDEGHTFHGKSEGLNISEVYRIDVAQGIGTKVVGGLQDNGGFALSNEAWYNYHGSDGMDAAIHPSGEIGYGLTQWGWKLKQFNFTNNTATTLFAGNLSGNWVTPMEMGNDGTLYAGSDHIYYLDDTDKWASVNNQTFTDIRNIRVAPDNDKIILFCNMGKDIYISDGTVEMNFSKIGTPALDWEFYNGIVNFDFNRNNSQIFYVVTNTKIFQSNDGGQSFFDITGSIPSTDRRIGILHQASSDNNSLYFATNNAVYYRNDGMDDWKLFNIGLPPMRISDIEINNVENHVLISSYGKGVWRSPVHDDALTNASVVSTEQPSLIYPNPTYDDITLGFDLDEPSDIHIYALDGTLLQLYQREKIFKGEKISLNSYPSGTYILRIISDNHHINRKILKQ